MGNCLPKGIFIGRYANLEKKKKKTPKTQTNKNKTNIKIIDNYIDFKNNTHKLNELIDYLDTNITDKTIQHEENFNKIIKYNTFIITRSNTQIAVKRHNTI